MKNNNKKRQYFTMIEMLAVIIIIGLLSTFAAVGIPNIINRSRVSKAKADISTLSTAVNMYYMDIGRYPTTLEDLVTNPGSSKKWGGPYLSEAGIPEDPWGESYQYASPGQHGKFDIYSFGADGTMGGDDFDADIGNWTDANSGSGSGGNNNLIR